MHLKLLDKNFALFTVILLTLVGAFMRGWGLDDFYYWYDEMWHVYVAKQPTLADVFYVNLTEDGHPILPYFIWHFMLHLWDNEWSARAPSLFFGTAAIPFSYLMGKEVFKTKHGAIYTVFFFAFSKLMFEQSQLVRGYSIMMFFTIAAMWAVFAYARSAKLKYFLIYIFSISISLLCEFAVIPVMCFTNLFLLHSIWKKLPRKYFELFIYILVNIFLLYYLLWFDGILHDIGGVDFDENGAFKKRSIITFIFYNILGISQESSPVFLLGEFLINFYGSFVAVGIFALLEKRKKIEIWFLIIFFISSLILYYLDKLPLLYARRNIGMVFLSVILSYHGVKFIFEKLSLEKKLFERYKIQKLVNLLLANSEKFKDINYLYKFLMIFSLLILIIFLASPQKSRDSIYEFGYKKEFINQYFRDVNANTKNNDIIITQKTMGYYLAENFQYSKPKLVASNVYLFDAYKIPIYFPDENYRTCSGGCLNAFSLQEFVRDIVSSKQVVIKNDTNIILTSLFSGNMMRAINPTLYNTSTSLPEDEYKKLLFKERVEFSSWLDKNAKYKNVQRDCSFTSDDGCAVVYVIYSIPAKSLISKMLNSNYHNPKKEPK